MEADNLNHVNQRISNGSYSGQPIPRLIPVDNYYYPQFPISDNSYTYLTLIGSPIAPAVVAEMLRVFDKSAGGRIYLYDPQDEDLDTFEKAIFSSKLIMDGTYNPRGLPSPFSQIYLPVAEQTKAEYVMTYKWYDKEL